MKNYIQIIPIESRRNKNDYYQTNYLVTPNKTWSLQIINMLLIILFIFSILNYLKNDKNNLLGKTQNINIMNANLNLLSDKISFLKILTNNDELQYKGMLECLLKIQIMKSVFII